LGAARHLGRPQVRAEPRECRHARPPLHRHAREACTGGPAPTAVSSARARQRAPGRAGARAAASARRAGAAELSRRCARVAAAPGPPRLDQRATVVRWWAAGYAAWSQWKPSGLAWAHALRAEMGRFPYLLSVPIRNAADHDDGQLAGGYFLLLEHVENTSPRFMRTAFERA